MKTEFTPGPWKANRVLINNEPDRMIVSMSGWAGYNIADCGPCDGDNSNQQNARLIATAPELFDAAVAVLTDLDNGLDQEWDSVKQLKAAINKAKGNQ